MEKYQALLTDKNHINVTKITRLSVPGMHNANVRRNRRAQTKWRNAHFEEDNRPALDLGVVGS
ncbi:MAG TPA: hypothetical protein DEO56_08260 [Nitrosomonas nitrosa]|nr:hypothetical protein [Nitrosomonas nitrosa]HNP51831.1 hypothetical protein [Nitrosomonas nitrosa]